MRRISSLWWISLSVFGEIGCVCVSSFNANFFRFYYPSWGKLKVETQLMSRRICIFGFLYYFGFMCCVICEGFRDLPSNMTKLMWKSLVLRNWQLVFSWILYYLPYYWESLLYLISWKRVDSMCASNWLLLKGSGYQTIFPQYKCSH